MRYGLPPHAPYVQPLMARPGAAPCGPGRNLPEGRYVARGGVFEGAAMSSGDSHCGYWSDYVGELQGRNWPMVAPNGTPVGARMRVLPTYPAEGRTGFAPRALMAPASWSFERERPTAAVSMAGFGENINPSSLMENRSLRIWTGPRSGADPRNMTARGGVLDGNTLAGGQNAYAAYYDAGSPEVMEPYKDVNILPNPLRQAPVPSVGWGMRPDGLRSDVRGGAQAASQATTFTRRLQAPETQPRALCPKGVAARSVFRGSVPGGAPAASSIFATPVYENGHDQNDVPRISTLDPTGRTAPATADGECSAFGAAFWGQRRARAIPPGIRPRGPGLGAAGPDGLGGCGCGGWSR